MTKLLEDRLGAAGDDVYACLMGAYDGLSDAECAALNARLILILINVVGDKETVINAIDAALLAGEPRAD